MTQESNLTIATRNRSCNIKNLKILHKFQHIHDLRKCLLRVFILWIRFTVCECWHISLWMNKNLEIQYVISLTFWKLDCSTVKFDILLVLMWGNIKQRSQDYLLLAAAIIECVVGCRIFLLTDSRSQLQSKPICAVKLKRTDSQTLISKLTVEQKWCN